MKPFDLEVWFGDRIAVLGSNGSGKSHFLRLLARGGTDPDALLGHVTEIGAALEPVAHSGRAVLGARVRPGWFAQTHRHPEYAGRSLLDILHRGDDRRAGMPRDAASSALDRYGLVRQAEQSFDSLSGGQQARFQVLLLELSGATLLLLDEPTDNLDLVSAEALEEALGRFEGTVLAVTHDRWFARSSTASWSSAPTAGSWSPMSRSGMRRGWRGRDSAAPARPLSRVAGGTGRGAGVGIEHQIGEGGAHARGELEALPREPGAHHERSDPVEHERLGRRRRVGAGDRDGRVGVEAGNHSRT
jgi:ABC-type Mn2+/Zn2+ transport system ATPase subunit